jgi:hypothetical protein
LRSAIQRAFASGALFLGFAIFFYAVAHGYPAGTRGPDGPGYFPRLLAIVLAVIGLAVMAGAMKSTADAVPCANGTGRARLGHRFGGSVCASLSFPWV